MLKKNDYKLKRLIMSKTTLHQYCLRWFIALLVLAVLYAPHASETLSPFHFVGLFKTRFLNRSAISDMYLPVGFQICISITL